MCISHFGTISRQGAGRWYSSPLVIALDFTEVSIVWVVIGYDCLIWIISFPSDKRFHSSKLKDGKLNVHQLRILCSAVFVENIRYCYSLGFVRVMVIVGIIQRL